jgi:hypothetical protein
LKISGCLKKLVAMTPAKLMTKTEFISIKLVEQLVNMQPLMAEQVIVALIPLLSRSEGLTNNLIVNLRKAINRPLASITKMAISSLLTMIQQLRIKKFNMANSQATQQFSSNSSACSQVRQVEFDFCDHVLMFFVADDWRNNLARHSVDQRPRRHPFGADANSDSGAVLSR